ncbi:MAG: C40 family peptidase [Gemmatimonadetes bacterium]|nr:C40 family peptidase [Gemmatimonadota bacterium]
MRRVPVLALLCLLLGLPAEAQQRARTSRPTARRPVASVASVAARKPNPRGPFARQIDSVEVHADSLVAHSRSLLGIRYVWAGATPERGLDCSGLVQYVFGRLGLTLPHSAAQLARLGSSVPNDTSAMRPGDLMVFSQGRSQRISHVGIYVGEGKMIHASSAQKRVIEVPVINYRALRLRDVRRVVTLAQVVAP